MRKIIIKFLYSVPTDLAIALLLYMAYMILCIWYTPSINIIIALLLFIIFRAFWMFVITPHIGINKKLKIFCISTSWINPKKHWISQRSFVKFKQGTCIANMLKREQMVLLHYIIKSNEVFYMNTHEEIVKMLSQHNISLEKTFHGKNTLKNEKSILIRFAKRRKYKCNLCGDSKKGKCPVYKNMDKKTNFYNVKIRGGQES